jgi:acyl dehydratase
VSEFLGSHVFTPDDLIRFAELSGDWNPIHVDRVAARRLLVAEQVVHGMLALLWALDRHFAKSANIPARVTAFFQRPLVIGEQATVHGAAVESDIERLSLQHHGGEAVSVVLRGTGKKISQPVPNHNPSRTQPKPFTFADLRGVSGTVEVSATLDTVTSVFPHTCDALGIMPVAAVMALSRIVGMECPGLHSLYTGLDLTLGLSETQPQLHWQVVRHTSPLAPVRIEARGSGIAAGMDAFVRPAPVEQPSMQHS